MLVYAIRGYSAWEYFTDSVGHLILPSDYIRMLTGVLVVVANLVADLLLAVLDPRIRYE